VPSQAPARSCADGSARMVRFPDSGGSTSPYATWFAVAALRAAAESSDEFAPSKANAHLALPCRGRIARPKPVVLTFRG
jgi:hypothetical protein